MTEEYLAEALQEVSDEYIMEASLPLRRHRRGRAALGFAACFALVAALSLLMQPHLTADNAVQESESAVEDTENGSFDGNFDGAFYSHPCSDPPAGDAVWDVKLTVKDVSATGLTLLVTPHEGAEGEALSADGRFTLERSIGGEWVRLTPAEEEPTGTDLMQSLATGETVRWELDWSRSFGTLEAGDYRIGKTLWDWKGTASLYQAEFTIR